MENTNVSTPTRTPHSRSRSVLGEISLSGSRLNIPSPVPSEKYRATTTAANRLIDFNRGTSPSVGHKRSLSTASGPRHRRRHSKATRHHFLQRIASHDSEIGSGSDSVAASDAALDLGDCRTPITHFRPQLWRHLEPTRTTLNLDLFWPQKVEEEEEEEYEEDDDLTSPDKNVFPLHGLLPLCEFRNLRSLRLGGMLQSYQKYIWRTCWLNPALEELVLEMALEPAVDCNLPWIAIHGSWCRKSINEARTDYLWVLKSSSES
jgi:hypothetical protein